MHACISIFNVFILPFVACCMDLQFSLAILIIIPYIWSLLIKNIHSTFRASIRHSTLKPLFLQIFNGTCMTNICPPSITQIQHMWHDPTQCYDKHIFSKLHLPTPILKCSHPPNTKCNTTRNIIFPHRKKQKQNPTLHLMNKNTLLYCNMPHHSIPPHPH